MCLALWEVRKWRIGLIKDGNRESHMARKVQFVLNDEVWAMLQEMVPKGRRSELIRQVIAQVLVRSERLTAGSAAAEHRSCRKGR